jgi:hypothetical protein
MAAVRSVMLVKWPRRSAWRSVMEKNTYLDSSTDPRGLDGIDHSMIKQVDRPPRVNLRTNER